MEALQWLLHRGFDSIELELDSKIVVESLHCKSMDLNSMVLIILGGCLSLLFCLNVVSVIFVKGSANQSAHILTQAFVLGTDCMEWLNVPSNFLLYVLHANLS